MVLEMESDQIEDMDVEVLSSMWPEESNSDIGKQFNVEKPEGDQDMLEEVLIKRGPLMVDFKRLSELTDFTDQGSSQMQYLMKQWEYKQANAVRLLREELDNLSRQKEEAEIKEWKILEEHRFEGSSYGNERPISVWDDGYDIWQDAPARKHEVVLSQEVEIEAEYDTVAYWKQRALHLEKLLEASIKREQALMERLKENIESIEKQTSPVEELSQILKRADSFLHFVLQNAPVVVGHQDKDLKYRFIYNKFPSLQEEDILGKSDIEIFTGAGVKESQEFKREVLEKGLPAKREITFDTELFGLKTFLIYVEPVFNKVGETIGINYMGMEITDQVRKREKMIKLREEIAVRKAMESELNKTIHITEETMRAKQMLATMSHEIRSPLSGVVGMAEILANTKLDLEQRQLLKVMISSGDLVLQLINDILDLSKVESGVMKLEATRFRPREVVKHVLQTAAASLQKEIILEGNVADDVPIEVIGDVLRIRQILTNLISNAVKFTHEGKVGIKLYVIPEPSSVNERTQSRSLMELSESNSGEEGNHMTLFHSPKRGSDTYTSHFLRTEPQSPSRQGDFVDGDTEEERYNMPETVIVWILCDVYDTGIGIPENALPNLFKRYMQVSADHTRKYGGTGLGLAICKQLVELMGGHITVTSRVNCGSTFTFVLPYKVSPISDQSDELSDMTDHETSTDDDITEGFFQFQPCSYGSWISSNGSIRSQELLQQTAYSCPCKLDEVMKDSGVVNNVGPRETAPVEDACSVSEVSETFSDPETSSSHSTGIRSMRMNGVTKEDKGESNMSTDGCIHFQQNVSDADSNTSRLRPKILLVEDNKINVMVAQSMMKQLGHSIDVVNNGVEAIVAVQHCNYDLILMDVCMPVMDGLQATRLIRSFEETGKWDATIQAGVEIIKPSADSVQDDSCSPHTGKRVRIIAMTANAPSESAEECFANGMDSFISKPVTFQKLKECLEQYLPRGFAITRSVYSYC
ncbi:PREDICTED: histidine kinase 5-like [Tarenaya hassleriana]|uniref:histidine kinase 5-like n=1 Tax=Tarenaya hassleriana TaxID=28532 RepID=UPI00053C7910|nr:PREDICTED: histidine kinase 5-like [Tarenaya hassleriana]XP_010548556.1 PREDICTED: histidine kinase 5-like [Tarenaya hassleriana]XP_019058804.1 PREDICTED: histidine kinase 5-like [Tarenaya hassleriana]